VGGGEGTTRLTPRPTPEGKRKERGGRGMRDLIKTHSDSQCQPGKDMAQHTRDLMRVKKKRVK